MQERSFAGLNQIKILNLSGNSLTNISERLFPGFGRIHLVQLDFSTNNIQLIQPGAFSELRYLQHLDLSANAIRDLNELTFDGMRALRKLFLQNNDILNIQPRTFKELTNLEQLDLSNNQLQTLSNDMFNGNLNKLRKLWLKSNALTVIQPRAFDLTPNIDYLSLSFNELNRFDAELLKSLSKLRKFHITNNQIEDFAANMFNYTPSLQEFYFNENRLTFFPDISVDLPRLKGVAIEGNPWQCACLNDMINFFILRNIDYRARDSPYFDGSRPVCVVTPAKVCVKNLELVKQYHIVELFEEGMELRRLD